MNKLTEVLKQHVYCIIIVAVVILVSGAIVAYETQDDALSITASIVSIVLAVAVIIYTFYHSERSSCMTEQSERNMRETKEAVSEILYKTANTEAMLNQMQSQTATNEKTAFKVSDNLDFSRLHTSNAVKAREDVINNALKPKTDDEKIKYLVRIYVNVEFSWIFEKTYSLIYGSQVLLLEELEQNRNGLNDDSVRSSYYAIAIAKDPVLYENYSYENYMNFLASHVLIIKENDTWKITDVGLDFMNYLKSTNTLVHAREKLG
jgi:hypothetical protein